VDFREWQIDSQPRAFGEVRFFLHPEHSGWKGKLAEVQWNQDVTRRFSI